MISRHGKGLTGLDIGYRIHGREAYTLPDLPPTLWDTCPNLTVFGVDASHILIGNIELLGTARDKGRRSSIEVLLHRVTTIAHQPPTATNDLQVLKGRWNVARFICDATWAEVPESQQRAILNIFKDVTVVDLFNISLRDGACADTRMKVLVQILFSTDSVN